MHYLIVFQSRIEYVSASRQLARSSICDIKSPIPNELRDRWPHSSLHIDLGHRKAIICQSLYHGPVELE